SRLQSFRGSPPVFLRSPFPLHAIAPANKRPVHGGAAEHNLQWMAPTAHGRSRAMAAGESQISIRNTRPADFAGIGDLCRRVYPETSPWNPEQLGAHLGIFPDGQFVAVFGEDERVVGMSSSLIIKWDHYDMFDDWD